jgi:hypothetical protein
VWEGTVGEGKGVRRGYWGVKRIKYISIVCVYVRISISIRKQHNKTHQTLFGKGVEGI